MNALIAVLNGGKDLDSLQTAARAIKVGALICIRLSGRRSFGQRSAFDDEHVFCATT